LLAAASVFQGRLAARAVPLDSVLLSEVRLPVWQSALEMIADHPWLGVGLDGFRFVYPRYMHVVAWTEPLLYHPHNMWLDAIVRLGVPGLLVFGSLVVLTLREIGQSGKCAAAQCRAVGAGCLAGVWAGLAHGMVDSGYFVIDLAWSLALVAGLLAGPHRRFSSDAGAPPAHDL
jgi:O-antigen ligase